MSQIDQNVILASVIKDLAKESFSKILMQVGNATKRIITKYITTFESYTHRMYERCSKVRVAIDKDRLYDLDKIYVKTRFACSGKFYSDDEIIQAIKDNQRVVVQGFGGIGKTIFMKYCWVSIFNNPAGKVPIFLELRRLNEITNKDIISYTRNYISLGGELIPDSTFHELMTDGRFIFILDGFDELIEEARKSVEKQILELAFKYGACGFVVSSRHDSRFHSWEDFQTYRAIPFNKAQVRQVVSSIDFDSAIRKKFINEVLELRYDRYKEFLATPLLSLMMLFTYHQFAEVPEKVHIFYRYAFQTLYSLHDAVKESFSRERKSGLNEDDFAKVFSIFCLISYLDEKHSFDDREIFDYMERSKTRAGLDKDFSVENFINESIESVNLLYREGNIISFTHRSFQEYFCADCIVTFFQKYIRDLVNAIPRRADDAVFMMMYEMNSELVEDGYIIPVYEEMRRGGSYFAELSHSQDEILRGTKYRYMMIGFMGKRSKRQRNPTLLLRSFRPYPSGDSYIFCTTVGKFFSDRYRREVGEFGVEPPFERFEKLFAACSPLGREVDFDTLELSYRYGSAEVDLEFVDDGFNTISVRRMQLEEFGISEMISHDDIKKYETECSSHIMAHFIFLERVVSSIRGREKERKFLIDQILPGRSN